MDNATKQAIIKIGTDAYRKGIDDTFETVIDAFTERAQYMDGWTPDMYIVFVKEIQIATITGCETVTNAGA